MTNLQAAAAVRAREDQQATLERLFAPWDSLTDPEKYRRRNSARYMALAPRNLSPAAQGLVATMMDETIIPFKAANLSTAIRPTTLEGLSVALGVWLAELLAAANRGLWVQHSIRRDSFRKLPIGWQAFTDCKGAMERDGLVVAVRGRWDQASGKPSYVAPIFRPTPKMLEVAEGHGVTPWDVGVHFADGQDVREGG